MYIYLIIHLTGWGDPGLKCRMWQINLNVLHIHKTVLLKAGAGKVLGNFRNMWSL